MTKNSVFFKLLVMLGFTLGIAVNAHAAIVSTKGSITYFGTGWGGEGLYLTINQTLTSPCPNNSTNKLFMGTDALQYMETVAIVMQAYALQKPITVWYQNNSCPSNNLPALVAVNMD